MTTSSAQDPKRPARRAALMTMLLVAIAAACGGRNRSGDVSAWGSGDLSNLPALRRSPDEEVAAACGTAAPPTAGQIRRRPYLQQVTDRSATIVWTSTAHGPSAVTVTRPRQHVANRIESTVDGTARPPGGAVQRQAILSGLEPATIYCYRVLEEGAPVAAGGFRSAARTDAADPFAFIAFGDSGNGSSDQRALFRQMMTVPSDLVLHTGDLAYDSGTRAELDSKFFAVYADLLRRVPAYPSLGNHDYLAEGGAPFVEAFVLPDNGGDSGRERWYSFDWGQAHFVALDTERTGAEQAAWLEADLAASRQRWVIVYGHKPPYSSGYHRGDVAFRQHFVPVLERHAVALVLSGHDHDYERTKPINGVTYVVTGGGGRGTRPMGSSAFTAFGESVLNFVQVTVTADALALHAIDATGREFDSAVIRK